MVFKEDDSFFKLSYRGGIPFYIGGGEFCWGIGSVLLGNISWGIGSVLLENLCCP